MSEAAILEAAIASRRSGFSLRAEFVLRSQWTVLFGASGAGKTTLLRILAGLAQPTSGTVTLGTTRILDTTRSIAIAPGQRRIGFVMQQAALFPHLMARENIGFGLHTWAREAREARIDEMLRQFEIESLATRRPRQLSGGERQRVALAQALAPRPELLLLDEPFNAMDAGSRTAVIEKLRTAEIPTLYVSHDLGDAWQTNADALLLEGGTITARGPARSVLARQREEILKQLGVNTLLV
jgi:ABC-type sulfate/molybdate transport systems ATPase subunit